MGFTGYLTKLGIPFPALNAYLAAMTEFFGGFALLLGAFARWASLPLIFTMLVAIATATGPNGFNIVNGGFEYNFVLIAALAAIFLMGPGKWSLMQNG